MKAYRAIVLDEPIALPVVPVPLTFNGDDRRIIGRASAFLRVGSFTTCTLEIDNEALAKHQAESLEGAAWYAGEFKVLGAVQ